MGKKATVIRSMSVVSFFVLAIGFSLVWPAWADYPERPITLTVTVDPGGTTDLLARALAVGMEKYLGRALVIANKGGAGGSIGLGVLANSKPDGYSLCVTQNVAMIDAPLMQKVTFKPLKSFTPVAVFAHSEHTALLVKSDAPWKTFKEFIDHVKKNPGKVKYSTGGVGGGMHVAMEYIAHKDDLKWVHVPYKGTSPARTALLGGHVDACSSGNDWPPFVKSGNLRVLATHGETRSSNSPDAPTLKELGYEFVSQTFHSIVGPAGLPADVQKKLETAVQKGMETQEFKTMAQRIYITTLFMDGKQYAAHLKDKWSRTEKDFIQMGIIKAAATEPF